MSLVLFAKPIPGIAEGEPGVPVVVLGIDAEDGECLVVRDTGLMEWTQMSLVRVAGTAIGQAFGEAVITWEFPEAALPLSKWAGS